MHTSVHQPSSVTDLPLATLRRPARRGAFALVITLLILSLLVVVAVSYLASMINERQTADAYTSKARAEQVAQAGVDSAMAILTQSFRDFPDSATVWDVQQTPNGDGTFNEGTSLYVRAVPSSTSDPAAYAVPQPSPASTAANDPGGNNPNNPACKTFVLPLVSGVPSGQAKLTASKSTIFPQSMDLTVTDPVKQTYTDLNIRRANGDTHGVIGSPVDWSGNAPKPTRAYWINLKGNDGRTTGRYAFWIEDESFRANISGIGTNGQTLGQPRIDNLKQPVVDTTTNTPRALNPGDVSLPGFLNALKNISTSSAVKAISPDGISTELLGTRGAYPGGLFPDPLAFTHSTTTSDGSSSATLQPMVDALRYSTTTQSGTLNYTRHGTQRLNLNGILPTPGGTPSPGPTPDPEKPLVNQSAVDQIVETLKFHLPNFGQRFYRTSTDTSSATLNAKQVAPIAGLNGDPATIYLYKIAANICDYLDTDSQPTMILAGGTVDTKGVSYGTGPLSDDQSNNTYWAQGKESSPLIQEVVVRYRPIVGTNPPSPIPVHHFDLQVDYYIEFWNMTDRDIYAAPQTSPNNTLPHLNNASVYVREQQPWVPYAAFTSDHSGGVFQPLPGASPQDELLSSGGGYPHDWQIDLSSSAVRGYDPATVDFTATPGGQNNTPLGVVFRAGAVTVITTDPDCFKDHSIPNYSYKYVSPYNTTALPDNYDTVHTYPSNVFYCPVVAGKGQREYQGQIIAPASSSTSQDGMMLGGEFGGVNIYSATEISLANDYGYLDLVRGAITKVKPPNLNYFYTITWKNKPPNNTASNTWRNDYSFGSALMGNVAEPTPKSTSTTGIIAPATPSELGDPRTNNEQLKIDIDPGGSSTANNSDGTHYMPGKRTLGLPNGVTVKPDLTTTKLGWGDYFAMPTGSPYPNTDATNAPAVIGDGPLTSIGQLGDVYDPARIQGTGGILYSRGGGRTFKIGQHDDLYSFDPTGSPTPYNAAGYASASTGWASWRLTDVFGIDDNPEESGRININGVLRDKGAALLAALDGWTFQPPTSSGTTTDSTIHGDSHTTGSLANTPLDTSTGTTSSHGAALLVNLITNRLNPTTVPATAATPTGPFFERGEFGELISGTTPIFGVNLASGAANTALVNGVDMNKTFDHSREETFRRLSELICTRGDTFTVYTVGQSIFQAPITDPVNPPPLKVTGTHRMRVTFRLVPSYADGTPFIPTFKSGTPISAQVATRFAKPNRYVAQVLAVNTF